MFSGKTSHVRISGIVLFSGAACSPKAISNNVVPVSPTSHVRQIKATGSQLVLIGTVTSVASFNILAMAGFIDSSGQQLVLQPKTFRCSAESLDTCRLPCDETDPDCAPQYDIATNEPVAGANCFASPGALGNNLPFGANDRAHTIVDIFALGQSSFGNGFARVGWVYKMGDNQTAYTQDSGDNGSYFQNALMQIPALAQAFNAIANAQKNSYIKITADEANAIIADYKKRRGRSAGSCFTKPLFA